MPVVPLLEDVERRPRTFWLAWYEEWRAPQPRKGTTKPRKDAMQFKASSVSVYAGLPGSAKRQVLRGEWAGAELAEANVVKFQGSGAAHPHWHLAGLADGIPAAAAYDSPSPMTFDALEVEAEVVDFVPDTSRHPSYSTRSVGDDAIWANVHLAASARWAEREWPGAGGPSDMHAFAPNDCAEIRRWILSCVRYLQSELQGQVGRGRHS